MSSFAVKFSFVVGRAALDRLIWFVWNEPSSGNGRFLKGG